jgi:hypothetical protein
MVKNCPPGVICIDNVNIFLFVILLLAFFLYFYNTILSKVMTQSGNSNSHTPDPSERPPPHRHGHQRSRYQDSVLLNPFMPPVRPNQYLQQDTLGIPVNVATQGENTSYKQIGILTRLNGKEMILPLMGRSLITNRDKWQFYTMSDTNNSVKLPVSNRGKSCTNEYGCDNIYNGDTVYVEGYNDAFKATVYENNNIRYIPYL